jgi:hypothetical protein
MFVAGAGKTGVNLGFPRRIGGAFTLHVGSPIKQIFAFAKSLAKFQPFDAGWNFRSRSEVA